MTTIKIGAHSVYASQIDGVVLDCDVLAGTKIGGGSPTDNTTAINAFLATATPTNPIELIIDGGLAAKTLVVPSTGNVAIRGIGLGSGIFTLNGANGHSVASGAGPSGRNVLLRDIFINGNWSGNSTSGDHRGAIGGPWYNCLAMTAITNITLDNVYLYNSPSYGAIFPDCKGVYITGGGVESTGRTVNSDGYHFSGGCSDIFIDGVRLATGDDGIAINSDEGSGLLNNRIIINNITFDDCNSCIRIYGKVKPTDKIIISNLVGTYRNVGIAYGLEAASPSAVAENNHSITMSNIDLIPSGAVTPTCLLWLNGSGGSLILDNVNLNNSTYAIPIIKSDATYNASGVLTNLVFNNCQIYRSAAGNAAAYFVQHNGGTIKNLTLSNCRVVADASYIAIANLVTTGGGTITNLILNGVYTQGVTTVHSGTITNIIDLNTGSGSSVGANLVLCGPASGGSATPAYRSLVSADIPGGGGGGTGALVLIGHATASNSANITFSSISNSSYSNYLLIGYGVIPVTASANLTMNYSVAGSFVTTGNLYSYECFRFITSGSAPDGSSAANTFLLNPTADALGNSTNQSFNFTANLMGFGSTTTPKAGYADWTAYLAGATPVCGKTGMHFFSNSAVDGIRLAMSSGNISHGEFYLYGYSNT